MIVVVVCDHNMLKSPPTVFQDSHNGRGFGRINKRGAAGDGVMDQERIVIIDAKHAWVDPCMDHHNLQRPACGDMKSDFVGWLVFGHNICNSRR